MAGAQWPSSFYGSGTDDNNAVVNTCWSAQVVQWALDQGCTWGKWKCQKLAAKRYYDLDRRQQAAELLAWAHNNGCPCTCDKAAAAAAAAGSDVIAVD